jgi:uncharacterized protein YndB with AHSA1/START domain
MSVDINRSPSEVFDFLADAENDARWRPSVIEVRRVEGSGVGARYHQMLRGPGGRSVAADIVVDELRPPSRIGFHTVSGPVRPTGHYDIAPAGTGSTVTLTLEAQLSGIKRLMSSMVEKSMASEVDALTALKQVLERR